MLELIDQSNPLQLRYRCPVCGHEGVSTPAEAGIVPPGAMNVGESFWIATPGAPKPGKWVRHDCPGYPQRPATPAPVVRQRKPKPAPAEPVAVAPKKRGRPRKVVPQA